MKSKFIALLSLVSLWSITSQAQTLHLADALKLSVDNYDKIKSKQSIVKASEQHTFFQKQQYLPDVTVAAQQSFGTVNMLHGPMYAQAGMAGSTSMPMAEQNWNAAFGSLYFANVNWNVFTFGRRQQNIDLGLSKEKIAQADVQQEIFQHEVKISAAYLNLLASQRVEYVQKKNWERAQIFYDMTNARAESGLIPEVDASLAKSEVSHAKSLQIKSHDKVLEYAKQLAVLMGDSFQVYTLDSLYSTSLPSYVVNSNNTTDIHPFLAYQQSKINESLQDERAIKTNRLPSLSAFGTIQARGSGFESNYVQDNSAYSNSYFKGIGFDRSNYLLGLTLSWNIMNLYRTNTKAKEQQFRTQSMQHDFHLLYKELNAQSKLAKSQLNNATNNFEETKVQLASAQLAYKQHIALYENGLTNLVDFTQALYSLNRAEINYEIAQNNVWQALLLLASAQGDLTILTQ